MAVRFVTFTICAYLLLVLALPFWRGSPTAMESSLEEIGNTVESFFQANEPVFRINDLQLLDLVADVELLDPNLALPQTAKYDKADLQILDRFAVTCRDRADGDDWGDLDKAFKWHQWLCQGKKEGPFPLENRPPFMHPGGLSFHYLRTKFDDTYKPGLQHRRYFHILEQKDLFEPRNSVERFVYGLKSDELDQFVLHKPMLLTDSHAVFRGSIVDPNNDRANSYAIYDIAPWRNHLARAPFVPVRGQRGQACGIYHLEVCWEYNRGRGERLRLDSQLSSLSLALGLGVVYVLFNHSWNFLIENRRRSRERNFLLQLLTHELRTPVASAKLDFEVLRHEFDSLSDQGKTAFLRMGDSLARMKRNLELSGNFLSSQPAKSTSSMEVADLQTLVQSCIEEHVDISNADQEPQLKYCLNSSIGNLAADQNMLRLVILNLLDNAGKHGEPPVVVTVSESKEFIEVCVQDAGNLSSDERKKLTQPFVKNRRSDGLGLGLNMVNKIVTELGGSLTILTNPTRFVVKFRRLG